MTPYYESDGIVLYLGDCRELLPQLAADSVDLVVTDPPYGVRWQSAHRALQFDAIVGDDSTEAGVVGLGLCIRPLRRGRHLYAFGRYDLADLGVAGPVELIWDRELFSGGDLAIPWGCQHDTIQFWVNNKDGKLNAKPDGGLATRSRRGSVLRCQRPNATAVINHPTEKPVDLLRQLIESSSSLYETVLDPFAGSGSTLVAAAREGRKAIGIEIVESYCETAASRLAALPRELFA